MMHPSRVELHRRYPWLDDEPPVPYPELEVTWGQRAAVWFTDRMRRLNFWLDSWGI